MNETVNLDEALRLSEFRRVGLDELGGASLMRRVDTKFVFNARSLAELADGLGGSYSLLDVAGLSVHDYLTLYFDTPSLDLFAAHHRGMGERIKVRERRYASTGQLFLEVKRRNNKGLTTKTRVAASAFDAAIDPDSVPERQALLRVGVAPLADDGELLPSLWNAYRRVTFVRDGHSERVTLDADLTFESGGAKVAVGEVVVAEVKQARLDWSSPFMHRLRAIGARPSGFSKYCMGVCLLRPQVRHNRFKPKLRALRRLAEGGEHVA